MSVTLDLVWACRIYQIVASPLTSSLSVFKCLIPRTRFRWQDMYFSRFILFQYEVRKGPNARVNRC
jgi:hypothetical protein